MVGWCDPWGHQSWPMKDSERELVGEAKQQGTHGSLHGFAEAGLWQRRLPGGRGESATSVDPPSLNHTRRLWYLCEYMLYIIIHIHAICVYIYTWYIYIYTYTIPFVGVHPDSWTIIIRMVTENVVDLHRVQMELVQLQRWTEDGDHQNFWQLWGDDSPVISGAKSSNSRAPKFRSHALKGWNS